MRRWFCFLAAAVVVAFLAAGCDENGAQYHVIQPSRRGTPHRRRADQPDKTRQTEEQRFAELMDLFADPDPKGRAYAAAEIRTLPRLAPQAVSVLILALGDPRPTVLPTTGEPTTPADEAATTLAEMGKPAIRPLLDVLKVTTSPIVREHAMDALLAIDEPGLVVPGEPAAPQQVKPAEESKEKQVVVPKTIREIPNVTVEIKKWQPVDLAAQFHKAVKAAKIQIAPPSDLGVYRKGKWHASKFVCDTKENWHNVKMLLNGGHGDYFLFLPGFAKVYPLVDGDHDLLALPSADYMLVSEPDEVAAENGACRYSVVWPGPDHTLKLGEKKIEIRVLADVQNARKVLFRVTPGEKDPRVLRLDLSAAGNCCALSLSDSEYFYIFDTKTLDVVTMLKGRFETMNQDGSVLIYNNGALEYHRLELKSKADKMIWFQTLTKWGFMLSPNGNFCVCLTENHGPNYIDVYVNSTGQYFHIDAPCERDWFEKWYLNNDGTIYASSGTYAYRNGAYVWATKDEKRPDGLSIEAKQF